MNESAGSSLVRAGLSATASMILFSLGTWVPAAMIPTNDAGIDFAGMTTLGAALEQSLALMCRTLGVVLAFVAIFYAARAWSCWTPSHHVVVRSKPSTVVQSEFTTNDLPSAATLLVQRIITVLDAHKPISSGLTNETAYTANAIRNDYLPKTLLAYREIPAPDRWQYDAALMSQLSALDDATAAIARDVTCQAASSLKANGAFIAERLASS
jgi:hypothetical protein